MWKNFNITGPACFATIVCLLFIAIWLFQIIKKNQFFLYYAEGKNNLGALEDHDAEVDTLCYKDIVKKSWTYLVAGYVNYTTTLMIFPALTSTGNDKFLITINYVLIRLGFVEMNIAILNAILMSLTPPLLDEAGN